MQKNDSIGAISKILRYGYTSKTKHYMSTFIVVCHLDPNSKYKGIEKALRLSTM